MEAKDVFKVIGNFNNVSKETMSKVPPFRGQVKYRILKSANVVDNQGKITTIYNQEVGIPTRCWIMDNGNPIEIGVVDKVNKEGDISTLQYTVLAKQSFGFFTLDSSNPEDHKFYYHFELCNANSSNENRDKAEEPLFMKVDFVKNAAATNNSVDELTEALLLVKDMKFGEMKVFAESMNFDVAQPDSVIIANVKEYAKNNPETFILLAGNKKGLEVKSAFKQALDSNKIAYDTINNKLKVIASDEVLMTFDKGDERLLLDKISEWVNTNTNGQKVLATVKGLIKPSVAPAAN